MKQSKDQCLQAATTFCDLALIIGSFQNQLQATRELLTLRPDFHPECLFNYLSNGEPELTKCHIQWFMEQNLKPIQEEEIRLIFSIYGYKDKLSYADFLNYIYPFDVETIKTISTVHSKKYVKTDERVSEEIRCIFLLLIQKEIEFLHSFEELKSETSGFSSRESIKKSIKLLKKFIPQLSKVTQSDYVLTFQECKGILKKVKNLPERKSQPICRRLSMQKDSFIGLDQLESWLKPWPKLKPDEETNTNEHQTLFEDLKDTRALTT